MKKKGLLLLGLFLVLTSCGEYQKVLKSEEPGVKYTMAEKLYNQAKEENSKAKFRKALRLLEQIVPQYRGKPQGEKLAFLYADSYFELKDSYNAGYQFERFTQSYPNSDKVEEAAFKSAKSYYFLSPRYDLDQTETVKAIDELQKYIDAYPNGEYLEEANVLAADLRVKLEKKAYEIAKQYHHTTNYKSAIVAFNNFITEYPGSPFREAAFYYRFDSAYKLAINSYQYLMKERLETAKGFYNNYQKYYPEGSVYYNQLQTDFQDLDTRLQNF
ncbi:outer membrane protein assembly factor BamD [Gillisia sp. M10.2A]|uniref:Outer membrane protein assembly factor BamD n=2 Tax=Gillisia lutea TaxID=2909668 RepID=A0ABS9EDJ4_9FLAO|nr:outer membrane protein assembly factor BamD [Gillisia lutea]MCF4100931.1 outer membrane protein assembly factor BamD [Gillisia lutea]